jgi:predicted ester cyclase
MGAADKRQVARDLITALWEGRTEAAHQHPGYWQTLHTFEAVRAAFPDLTATIQQQLTDGDVVVTVIGLAGTHSAPFLGAEPTGQPVAWTIVYVDTVRDGKVVEHASGDGWMDLLMRIGAVPPPR